MANQTKDILKGYFNTGDIPSEANFQDLIDSSLNQAETICQVLSGSLKTHITGSGTYGSGMQGTGDGYKYNVIELNNEKITTIVVDLQGLSSSATTNNVIGLSGSSDASLFRYYNTVHGSLYKVEIGCAEEPAGGEPHLSLKFSGSAQSTFANIFQSANVILSTGGDLNTGELISNVNSALTAVPSDNDFVYLVNGSSGTDAAYTAGKLIIKFYGLCSDSY